MKTIMAIGGHIGDMELTCGGVLASMALEGHKIITVALTGGEKGNPPGMSTADYRVQKVKEASEFANLLGGDSIVFPYADGELPVNDEVCFQLCDVIRQYKPNVLITHWKNSIHKDHEAAHIIVKNARFYAALPGFERNSPPHFAAGPYYAENWEDPEDFDPYMVVEVTEAGFELWEKAIDLHWFTTHSTSFRYKEYYTHLMSMRGIPARKKYAQAFDINREEKRLIRDSL